VNQPTGQDVIRDGPTQKLGFLEFKFQVAKLSTNNSLALVQTFITVLLKYFFISKKIFLIFS